MTTPKHTPPHQTHPATKRSPDDVPPPHPPGVPPDGPVAAGTDPKLKAPPFGTPKPAKAGDLPRVCDPLERAAAGQMRVKFAARDYPAVGAASTYRTAAKGDLDGAKACYLEASGQAHEVAKLKKAAGPKADEVTDPVLAVTELPD